MRMEQKKSYWEKYKKYLTTNHDAANKNIYWSIVSRRLHECNKEFD